MEGQSSARAGEGTRDTGDWEEVSAPGPEAKRRDEWAHTRVTRGTENPAQRHLEVSSPGAPLARPAALLTAAGMGAATHRCTGRAGRRRERMRRGHGETPEDRKSVV